MEGQMAWAVCPFLGPFVSPPCPYGLPNLCHFSAISPHLLSSVWRAVAALSKLAVPIFCLQKTADFLALHCSILDSLDYFLCNMLI
jgi:hypothetical protein